MTVSVLIPTLNEADNIAEAIDSVRLAGDCEIIVIDGRSQDETALLAEKAGADCVLQVAPSRGGQLNAGYRQSTGEILLILHADCRLPPACLSSCVEQLSHFPEAIGFFRQSIRAKGWYYRSIEGGNKRRANWSKMIYGDQGMMLYRQRFEELGCFPEVPFMEDFLFCRRLSWFQKVVCFPEPLSVSARRWEKKGVFWQTLSNWNLSALSFLGYHPEQKPEEYPNVRSTNEQSSAVNSPISSKTH